MENYEQIFDGHISQTFLNLLGGNEKLVVQSGMDEDTLVMATPRRRRVEPETEAVADGMKIAADVEKPLSMFIIMHCYMHLCFRSI